MAAQLMEGTELAREVVSHSAARAAELEAATGVKPCLATVIVGDDPASVTYVRMKENRSRRAGIDSRHVGLPAEINTSELVSVISGLSADPGVHGILLQHPVPPQIDERAAFEAIAPGKDVDGVTMHSFAAMAFGYPGFVSCTPGGIMRLLDAYGADPAGKHAVVVGRSPILGKPVGMLLLGRNATVTYCHSRTRDLPDIVRTADIVVAAVGRPEFVRGDWIKPGAVVVDAGYNPGNVGDVALTEAVDRASLLTPVPGGVGPLTIGILLEQTVDAAFDQVKGDADRSRILLLFPVFLIGAHPLRSGRRAKARPRRPWGGGRELGNRGDFACTLTSNYSPVLVVLRAQSRLSLEGRTRTLGGPSPDLSPAGALHVADLCRCPCLPGCCQRLRPRSFPRMVRIKATWPLGPRRDRTSASGGRASRGYAMNQRGWPPGNSPMPSGRLRQMRFLRRPWTVSPL